MGICIDVYYINLRVFIEKMGFIEIVEEREKKTTKLCGKEYIKTLKHQELPFLAEYVAGQYMHDTEYWSKTVHYEHARICGEEGELMFRISVGGPYLPTITAGNVENILPFSEVIRKELPGKYGGKIIADPSEADEVFKSLKEILKIRIIKTKIIYLGSGYKGKAIQAEYEVE